MAFVIVLALLLPFSTFAPEAVSAQPPLPIIFPSNVSFVHMGGIPGVEIVPYNYTNISGGRINASVYIGEWHGEGYVLYQGNFSYVERSWHGGFDLVFGTPDPVTGVVNITIPKDSYIPNWHSVWDNEVQTFWSWNFYMIKNGFGKLYTGNEIVSGGSFGDVETHIKANCTGYYPLTQTEIWFWKNGAWHNEANVIADPSLGIGDGVEETEPYHFWLHLPVECEVYTGREPPHAVQRFNLIENVWYTSKSAYCIVEYPISPYPGSPPHPLDGFYMDTNTGLPLDITTGKFRAASAHAHLDGPTVFGPASHLWAACFNYEMRGYRIMGDASGLNPPYGTGDGVVNIFDYMALVDAWLGDDSAVYLINTTQYGPANPDRYYKYNPMVDFKGMYGVPDGVINILDYMVIVDNWLKYPIFP